MATDTSDILELVCNRIFEQIDQSERGKWSIKTKTLMAEFGYQAAQRVRQSSLDAVLDTLEEWNIEYRFPSGLVGANEYSTRSRGQASRQPEQSASVQSFDATQERREGCDRPWKYNMTPKTIISKLENLTTITMREASTGKSPAS